MQHVIPQHWCYWELTPTGYVEFCVRIKPEVSDWCDENLPNISFHTMKRETPMEHIVIIGDETDIALFAIRFP